MASDAAIGPFLELGQIWCERLVHSSSRFTMCASSPPKLPSDHSLRRRSHVTNEFTKANHKLMCYREKEILKS